MEVRFIGIQMSVFVSVLTIRLVQAISIGTLTGVSVNQIPQRQLASNPPAVVEQITIGTLRLVPVNAPHMLPVRRIITGILRPVVVLHQHRQQLLLPPQHV